MSNLRPLPKDNASGSTFWRSVRAVLWAFVGIRKGSESQADFAKIHPLHIVFAGVVGAVLLVLLLVAVVSWVLAP